MLTLRQQARPPDPSTRLCLAFVLQQRRLGKASRQRREPLHHQQRPTVRVRPTVGAVAVLDRRVDARHQLLQPHVVVLLPQHAGAPYPDTGDIRTSGLDFRRSVLGWGSDGRCAFAAGQDTGERGHLDDLGFRHLLLGLLQRLGHGVRVDDSFCM